jgi:alpha-D-xyloside xylohydrolase
VDVKISLMPYLYATAIDTHKSGLAMMRPLFVEFPKDPTSWNIDTQYLLGPNLMVAPVFSEEGTVQYYVPEGEWYGLLDGKTRQGTRYYTETHDFMSLPLLLRPGSAIVMREQGSFGATSSKRKTVLYDYCSDITLWINASGKSLSEVIISIPHSEKPGEFAAVLKVSANEDRGCVEVVSGEVRGSWKVKHIQHQGPIKEISVEGQAKVEWLL